MYKLFKRFFADDILNEILSFQKGASNLGYDRGLEEGYENAKREFDEQLDQKAKDLYAQQNYLVNPNHVFQVSKSGIPFLGLEPIKKDKLKDLQVQAKSLLDTELWTIITTMIRSKAVDKAIKESTEWAHVLPGKMMVHNISLIESLVDYISKVDLAKIPDSIGRESNKVI